MKQFHSSDVSLPVSIKGTPCPLSCGWSFRNDPVLFARLAHRWPRWHLPPSQGEQRLPFSTTIMTVVFTQGWRIL